jgi:hypothetical protein
MCHEGEIDFSLSGLHGNARIGLVFQWAAGQSALREVTPSQLNYRFRDFDYCVRIADGSGSETADGVRIVPAAHGALRLLMAQTS